MVFLDAFKADAGQDGPAWRSVVADHPRSDLAVPSFRVWC
jgi:hypothetical protein